MALMMANRENEQTFRKQILMSRNSYLYRVRQKLAEATHANIELIKMGKLAKRSAWVKFLRFLKFPFAQKKIVNVINFIWVPLLLTSTQVFAHESRPLYLSIQEDSSQHYTIILRAPATLEAADLPELGLPQVCKIEQTNPLLFELGSSFKVICEQSIGGQVLTLTYPSLNPTISTMVRFQPLGEEEQVRLLSPDQNQIDLEAVPTWIEVAQDYTQMGFEHILAGIDHLLFVCALLLLTRTHRKMLAAITGFTFGHSITLALATLGLAKPESTLVEVLIALSVVFMAAEILRPQKKTMLQSHPIIVASFFGLLHGFGFAGVLAEIGLPKEFLLEGLFFFNVGVELGQLTFISVCFFLWLLLNAICNFSIQQVMVGRTFAAYLIGVPAAYWCIERGMLLFVGG
jgi:hydrogenase/urease accessory protein HupE